MDMLAYFFLYAEIFSPEAGQQNAFLFFFLIALA